MIANKDRFDKIFKEDLGLSYVAVAKKMDVSVGHFHLVKKNPEKASDKFWRELKHAYPEVDVEYLKGVTDSMQVKEDENQYKLTNVNLLDINKRLIHLDLTHQDIKSEIYKLQSLLGKIYTRLNEL